MADPIIAVASQYVLRRYVTLLPLFGWTKLCPANTSRWSLRLGCSPCDGIFFSPFDGNDDAPGILLLTGQQVDFYLSRDPALVGQAWYARTRAGVPDTYYADVWEQTPAGT